jgi:hypothetical protein
MVKVRANRITIETPKEGDEPWIRVEVQRVEKGDNIYNVVDRWDSFNERMSKVGAETCPILMDPTAGVCTVYDIGIHLAYVISMWLVERYNGKFDPQTGDVIIEE